MANETKIKRGVITGTIKSTGAMQFTNFLNGFLKTDAFGNVLLDNSIYVDTAGSYTNPSFITSLAWSKITGTPTTAVGYGIDLSGYVDRTTSQTVGGNKNFINSIDVDGFINGYKFSFNGITTPRNTTIEATDGSSFTLLNNVNGFASLNIAGLTARGNVIIDNLKTNGTAPVTSGTTKMVIVDVNGLLSNVSMPSSGTTYTGTAPIVVSGSVISVNDASSTSSGVVNTNTQTFSGIKTFTNDIKGSANATIVGAVTAGTGVFGTGTNYPVMSVGTTNGIDSRWGLWLNNFDATSPQALNIGRWNNASTVYDKTYLSLGYGINALTVNGNTKIDGDSFTNGISSALYADFGNNANYPRISVGTSNNINARWSWTLNNFDPNYPTALRLTKNNNAFTGASIEYLVVGGARTLDVSGTFSVSSLISTGTAPTTTGITKTVVSDINGLLSFVDSASVDLSGYVTLSTPQTISGAKTFSNLILQGTNTSGTKISQVSGYSGIWFDVANPTLLNFNILFDKDGAQKTVISGPNGVSIRPPNNNYPHSTVFDANGVLWVYSGEGTILTLNNNEKLNVKGGIYASENIVTSSNVGIGNVVNPTSKLHIINTQITDATFKNVDIDFNWGTGINITKNNSGNNYGGLAYGIKIAGINATESIYGIDNRVSSQGGGAVAYYGEALAVYGDAAVLIGTVKQPILGTGRNAFIVKGTILAPNDPSVAGSTYGVHITNNTQTTVPTASTFGFKMENATTGPNLYGLHISGESKNYLSGSLGVGTLTRDAAYKVDIFGSLNVQGASTQRGMLFYEPNATLFLTSDTGSVNVAIEKTNIASGQFQLMTDRFTGGYMSFGSVGSNFAPAISFSAGNSPNDFTYILSYTRDELATSGAFTIDSRKSSGGALVNQPILSVQSYGMTKLLVHADGRLILNRLATNLTAPITSGAVKMVTTDINGSLSFTDIPSGGGGGWSLTGNTETTASNFIGTIDNVDLIFKSNSIERFRLNNSTNRVEFTSDTIFGGGSGILMSGNFGTPFIRALGTTGIRLQSSDGVTKFLGHSGGGSSINPDNSNLPTTFNANTITIGYTFSSNQVNSIRSVTAVNHLTSFFDIIAGGVGNGKNTDLRLYTENTSTGIYGNIILGHNGTSISGNVGIGTSNPTEQLQVNGKVKIVDGTQSNGYIFTSDVNGVGSWSAPTGINTTLNYNWTGVHTFIRNTDDAVVTMQNTRPYGTGGVYPQAAQKWLASDGSVAGYVQGDLKRLVMYNLVQSSQFGIINGDGMIDNGQVSNGIGIAGNSIVFADRIYAGGGHVVGRWFADGGGGLVIQNTSIVSQILEEASSLFTVRTTIKGTIPAPVMTTTQRDAIITPVKGLQVFNSITNGPNYYDGTAWLSSVGGSVAGSNTQIQFNNGGSFGASSTFTYNPTPTSSSLLALGLYVAPTLTASANNDVLVGMDLTPTFSTGSYTGVSKYAARINLGGNSSIYVNTGYILDLVYAKKAFTFVMNDGTKMLELASGSAYDSPARLLVNNPTDDNATPLQVNGNIKSTGTIFGNNFSSADWFIATGIVRGGTSTGNIGGGYGQTSLGTYTKVSQMSIALGFGSVATAANTFVAGSGHDNASGFGNNPWISDVYFGSGIQGGAGTVGSTIGYVNMSGVSYTINGSGAFGTDFAGGNITIAGGKGTGAANSGNVIFSTSNPLASGSILQSLSERMRIVGTTGNILIQTLKTGLAAPTTTGSTMMVVTDTIGLLSFLPIPTGMASQWTTTGTSIYYNTGNVLIGTSTDDGISKLQVNGAIKLGIHSLEDIIQGANHSLNLGGSIGAGSDRALAIYGTATGLLSLAIGSGTNATNAGVAIGGYGTTATGGIAIGNYIIATTAVGDGAVSIGAGCSVYGNAVGINGNVGTSANRSQGVAIMGNIGPSQLNGSIAIMGYSAANQSIALYGTTTSSNEFVAGSAYENGDMNNFAIKEIYFGSGKTRQNNANTQSIGAGISYTINGSGAFGTDFAGGNITIAGGKGTGAGAVGVITFATSALLGTSATLQSLTERMRIGSLGNLVIGSTIDSGHRLQVNGDLSLSPSSAPSSNSIWLNQGRNEIRGHFNGMTFNLGSGTAIGTPDSSKSYNFQNRGNTYMSMVSLGTASTAAIITMNADLLLNGVYRVPTALNTAPASATATGTSGEIRWVNGFVYLCVATNTWQRATLVTF